MSNEHKLAVDTGVVVATWSFPWTLAETSELVQLIAGVLSITFMILRIYGIVNGSKDGE
jgi:hypothetical protein